MHQAVYMQVRDWLKISLKNDLTRNKEFNIVCPKNQALANNHFKLSTY